MNREPQKPYYVPRTIQQLFTFTIAGVYTVQLIALAISTFSQSQQGSDYRPQLGYMLVHTCMPIMMFLIAYALNPRNLSKVSKAFESLLLTLSALIVWSAVAMLLPMVTRSTFWHLAAYDYLSSTALLVVFTVALGVLRQKKRWS